MHTDVRTVWMVELRRAYSELVVTASDAMNVSSGRISELANCTTTVDTQTHTCTYIVSNHCANEFNSIDMQHTLLTSHLHSWQVSPL